MENNQTKDELKRELSLLDGIMRILSSIIGWGIIKRNYYCGYFVWRIKYNITDRNKNVNQCFFIILIF